MVPMPSMVDTSKSQSLGFLLQSGLHSLNTCSSNATQRLETSGIDRPRPIYDLLDYGWSTCRITNENDFDNL